MKETKNKRLRKLILEHEIGDGDFLDDYNKKVLHGIAETITTGISFRNHQFVVVEERSEK